MSDSFSTNGTTHRYPRQSNSMILCLSFCGCVLTATSFATSNSSKDNPRVFFKRSFLSSFQRIAFSINIIYQYVCIYKSSRNPHYTGRRTPHFSFKNIHNFRYRLILHPTPFILQAFSLLSASCFLSLSSLPLRLSASPPLVSCPSSSRSVYNTVGKNKRVSRSTAV